MIYLGNLKYLDTIKNIIEKDLTLIYFICYIGDSTNITLNSQIIRNIEVECQKLDKFNVINYNPPSERPTHDVSNITLSRFGNHLFEELKSYEICKKLVELLDFQNKESFSQSFYQNFSFETDPADDIIEEIIEVKKISHIADNHHEYEKGGNRLTIEYEKINDEIFAKLIIHCSCSNVLIENITLESVKQNLESSWCDYSMKCDFCPKEFYIRPDLYSFKYLE